MNKRILYISLFMCLAAVIPGYADQTVVAQRAELAPVIDGSGTDEVWAGVREYSTYDRVAQINIILKAVYTDTEIFFLVSYPDTDKSDTHKSWKWDEATQMYKTGPDREDTFIFKWNMEVHAVDLSLKSDDSYAADIWFWKAGRSNPAGYADDKMDRVSSVLIPKSTLLLSGSGKNMYMIREGDSGTAASENTLYEEHIEDKMPGFISVAPTGSRADIKAKGIWADGKWTIEFGRALTTGSIDDIQFDKSKTYLFGVSRYEIAGREPDPSISQPLFGCGDISEVLILEFGQ
ncbi:MAG: ethylbenzene dehydrogenase-related protein [Candidatus Omnitrophota bacterium]